MTMCQPSRVHRFFSGIFHSRSRSASPKPQWHKQVDNDAVQEANQAESQKHNDLPHSAKSAQEVASSQTPRPLPVNNHKEIQNKSRGAQDGTTAPDGKPDTARAPSHAVMLGHSPDAKVSGTAYDEAWSLLSEDERANLSNETSIKTLFEKLDETDQQHQSNSWLKRGKMAAGLQYVSNILGYINLVTAWIPVPDLGAVLGLFKGIVVVCHCQKLRIHS